MATDWKELPDSNKEKYGLYLASREWSVLKRQVHERAAGKCERCRVNDIDAVHHLTYARKYRERLDDLQGTCRGCHSFIHGHCDEDPGVEKLGPEWSIVNVESQEIETSRSDDSKKFLMVDFGNDGSSVYVGAPYVDGADFCLEVRLLRTHSGKNTDIGISMNFTKKQWDAIVRKVSSELKSV